MASKIFSSYPLPSFLRGMARLFDFSGSLLPEIVDSPEEADAKALMSDWAAVGLDISQSIDVSIAIPHPAFLAQYEALLPGATDRIFTVVEKQSAHRQSLEKEILRNSLEDSSKGLWLGFFIGIAGLTIVGICAFLNQPFLGGIIATLDLGTLAGTFIYGSRKQSEKKEKNLHQT